MAAQTWATGADDWSKGKGALSAAASTPCPTQQYSCKYSPSSLKDTKLLGGTARVLNWFGEEVLGEVAGADSVLLLEQLLILGMVLLPARAGAAGQLNPAGQAVFTVLL